MKYWIATLLAIGISIFIFLLAVIADGVSEKTKNKKLRIFLEKFSDFIFDYFNPLI